MKRLGQKHVVIQGVEVSGSPRSELLGEIVRQLDTKSKSVIFTPNPEIVLHASRDAELRNILNSASFAVADGVGLKLASVLTTQGSLPIYPGRLLMVDLLNIASQKQLKVFVLGATGRVIHKTLDKIKLEYPSIHAQGNPGPILDVEALPVTTSDKDKETEVINQINEFKPDLLFVGFGAPKQEKWIAAHKDVLQATIIMAVGGSIDYFSGSKPLPPAWMASLGLEWLWRLINEKGHYKRVWRAVVVFPLKVIFDKLSSGSNRE